MVAEQQRQLAALQSEVEALLAGKEAAAAENQTLQVINRCCSYHPERSCARPKL